MTAALKTSVDEDDLVRRYLPVARLYFLRHGRGQDADDLAHQALLTAIEALRREHVRDTARVGGFVLGVCKNLVRAQARKDARRDAALARLGVDDGAQAAGPVAESAVDRFKLWSCLNALSARARDVVVRTWVGDDDAETIASAHSTTPGNIRVVRHRALAALHACLEGGAGAGASISRGDGARR